MSIYAKSVDMDGLGDSNTRWSEDIGRETESGSCWFYPRNEDDSMLRNDYVFYLWETVEATAGANSIAAIWRNRVLVLKDGTGCRGYGSRDTVAQVAMRRKYRKPEQQPAEQPSPGTRSGSTAHIEHDK